MKIVKVNTTTLEVSIEKKKKRKFNQDFLDSYKS